MSLGNLPRSAMEDPVPLRKLPLLLHAAVETFAAAIFIARPQRHLPGASEEARLILRSYGGLLLTVNGVCLAVVSRPGFDDVDRLITACVGSYHAWPIARAYMIIRLGSTKGQERRRVLGGPWVHLVVHMLLLAALLWASLVQKGQDILEKTEL